MTGTANRNGTISHEWIGSLDDGSGDWSWFDNDWSYWNEDRS